MLSLSLVHIWGLNGVLLSFGISILSIGFWQFPRLVYKYTFHQPLWNYFKVYLVYTFVAVMTYFVAFYLIKLVPLNNYLHQVFFNASVCLLSILIIYTLCFYKRSEFRTLLLYVSALKRNL